ncbi:hypothetical protein V8E53_001476 [Lactarius tabidus]
MFASPGHTITERVQSETTASAWGTRKRRSRAGGTGSANRELGAFGERSWTTPNTSQLMQKSMFLCEETLHRSHPFPRPTQNRYRPTLVPNTIVTPCPISIYGPHQKHVSNRNVGPKIAIDRVGIDGFIITRFATQGHGRRIYVAATASLCQKRKKDGKGITGINKGKELELRLLWEIGTGGQEKDRNITATMQMALPECTEAKLGTKVMADVPFCWTDRQLTSDNPSIINDDVGSVSSNAVPEPEETTILVYAQEVLPPYKAVDEKNAPNPPVVDNLPEREEETTILMYAQEVLPPYDAVDEKNTPDPPVVDNFPECEEETTILMYAQEVLPPCEAVDEKNTLSPPTVDNRA